MCIRDSYNTYGTKRVNAYKIIEDTLNMKDVRVFDYMEDDEGDVYKRQLVNEMNKKLGLSKGQAEAMKAGSMFGWDTPATDPKSYDKNGIPVRPKQKDLSLIHI